jgi:hypothetical protein
MDGERRQRSPRGLIENVSEVHEWAWPEQGPEEVSAMVRDLSARRSRVVDHIRIWRERASAVIEDMGRDPVNSVDLAESDILDSVCAAARVLKQLKRIEATNSLAERDPKHFPTVVLLAMELSSLVHQLDIVENEISISKLENAKKTLRENGENKRPKSDANRKHYQKIAANMWKKNAHLSRKQIGVRIERREGIIGSGPRLKAGTIAKKIRQESSH